MRRWVLIILLLVYPFQVALAVADKCCVTTPVGVTHHGAGQPGAAIEPVFLVDDGASALVDPHCPACVFGQSFYLPSDAVAIPAANHRESPQAFALPFPTSPPASRPERPKWPAAAS